MVKTKLEQSIIDALEAVCASHGIDIVDVEIVGATKAPCVRVRIDRADGEAITLDEVTAQNAWVSDAVEALDPFTGTYTLEVSSPGMKRPLRRASDFVRFAGSEVEVSLVPGEGQRRFKGRIVASDDATLTLELEDATSVTLPFEEIKKCTLKPVYDFKGGKEEN